MRSYHTGFTLIELLAVTAILIVITTIAIPSLKTIVSNQNLKKSEKNLQQQLSLVRVQAILENREITLKLGSLESDEQSQGWMPDGDVSLKTGQKNQLIFNKNGGLKNFNEVKEIELCLYPGASKSRILVLNALGKVQRVDEGSCK